jgi:hypothetical protein
VLLAVSSADSKLAHDEHGVHCGPVGGGQQHAARQHRGGRHHGAPLAADAVRQVPQAQLPRDDAAHLHNPLKHAAA